MTAHTYRQVQLAGNGRILIPHARWCDTFSRKLRGFTFQRHLGRQDGLVLVENRTSRINTSIHMFFVFFDLGIIWVNEQGLVVDKALAQPWRPSYVPQAPARYVIEGHPTLLPYVQIGETIEFILPT